MTDTLVTFDGGVSGATIVAGQNGIESTPDTLIPKFGAGIHNIGVISGSAANTADSRFRVDLGLSGDHYGSAYLKYNTAHTSTGNFVSFLCWANSSNSVMAYVRVGSDRALNIRVGATTIVRAGSAGEVPLNAWFRFDWQVTGTTINWRMFYNPEASASSTPDLSGTFTFTAATISRLVLGASTSTVTAKDFSYDTIRATNTGTWFAPYAPNTGPAVTVWVGGVEVAATMKVWNGTAEVAIGSIAKN